MNLKVIVSKTLLKRKINYAILACSYCYDHITHASDII